MLKTISPLLSPQLLKTLAEMGHGDEIIFSDAHFPAHAIGKNGGPQVIHADGLSVSALLEATIPLFELDSYAPPLVMMAIRWMLQLRNAIYTPSSVQKKPCR
ncbi:L-fucose mutarotase [Yersinia enterocolitica]|nr:L-fucose mutarotase [Yersinia enterocolitica]